MVVRADMSVCVVVRATHTTLDGRRRLARAYALAVLGARASDEYMCALRATLVRHGAANGAVLLEPDAMRRRRAALRAALGRSARVSTPAQLDAIADAIIERESASAIA